MASRKAAPPEVVYVYCEYGAGIVVDNVEPLMPRAKRLRPCWHRYILSPQPKRKLKRSKK